MASATDHEQLTGDVLRLGTVASVNHADATCTVETGDIHTGDLPWLTFRAGKMRVWCPPSDGEQIVLMCPEGDTEAGLVQGALYCDAFPPPSANPDEVLIIFDDGAVIAYDTAAHALRAVLPGGSTIDLIADTVNITADTNIAGNVSITGDVTITGKLTASEDVIGGGISLKDHKHGGVQAGGAQTGAPS